MNTLENNQSANQFTSSQIEGVDIPRLIKQLEADLPELISNHSDWFRSLPERATSRSCISIAELTRRVDPTPHFIVEHLIPEKSLILLSGPSGAGKSAFGLHQIVAALAGKPVAGHFSVARTIKGAIVVNAEMGERELLAYTNRAANGLGLTEAEWATVQKRLMVLGDGQATLRDPEGGADFNRLREALSEFPSTEVIFIDTLRQAFDTEENEARVISKLYDGLRAIIREFGVSVVLTHHNKKPQGYLSGHGDRIAGSGHIYGGLDVNVEVVSRGTGDFMTGIVLAKTRTPIGDVCNGYEWQIIADRTDTASIFRASNGRSGKSARKADRAWEEFAEKFRAAGNRPLTKRELGNNRHYIEKYESEGKLVKGPRRGRSETYILTNAPAPDVPGEAAEDAELAYNVEFATS